MTLVPMSGYPAPVPAMPGHERALNALKFVLWTYFVFATSMAALLHVDRLSEQVAWLLADLAAIILFFRYQSQFLNIALGNIVFTSWPVLACLSAVWSVAPFYSLYNGAQLLMTTLVAYLLCIQFRLEQLVALVFWAMMIAAGLTLATVLAMPSLGIEISGSWRGAFPTKNVMGDAMTLLVVSACCLFLQGRWRFWTALGTVIGLFLIFMTRSATPILSVLLTLAPLPYAYAFLRGRGTFVLLFGLTLVMLAVVSAVGFIAIAYMGLDPLQEVLSWFGKDRSLTGRTLLWELALQAMERGSALGYGFKGYWADPPAEMLHVRHTFGQAIHHFHNNYLEVAVDYGLIGPVLLAMGIVVALVRTLRRLWYAVEPIEIWPFLIVLQILILTPVQNPLMWNHSLWHILFVAAAVIRK